MYTKKKGEAPDFNGGLILKSNTTVGGVCQALHKTLLSEFKYALVWGKSCKFSPMRGISKIYSNLQTKNSGGKSYYGRRRRCSNCQEEVTCAFLKSEEIEGANFYF